MIKQSLILTWMVSTCICSYLVGSIQMENKYQRDAVRLDLAEYDTKTREFGFVEKKPACKATKMVEQDIPVVIPSKDQTAKELSSHVNFEKQKEKRQ